MSAYLMTSVAVGAVIGFLACMPHPAKGQIECAFSIALGMLGALAGWGAGLALGESQVGPLAQTFFAVVGASVCVAAYHVGTSEPPTLR